MEVYDALIGIRDGKKKKPFGEYRHLLNDVLSQLIVLAFTNTLNPDTLPKSFKLTNVALSKVTLKKIFKDLGLKVEIDPIEDLDTGNWNYYIKIL